MPDMHIVQQTIVGLVAQFQNRLSPNILGNDIGCGILTINLGKSQQLQNQDQLQKLFISLDQQVKDKIWLQKGKSDNPIDEQIINQSINILQQYNNSQVKLENILNQFQTISNQYKYFLGTLGSGNHFIELDYSDNTQQYYLLIHTGSRQLGKQIYEKYIKYASELFYDNQIFETLYEQLQQNDITISSGIAQDFKSFLIKKLKLENKQNMISSYLKRIKYEDYKLFSPEGCLQGAILDKYIQQVQILQIFSQLNRLCIYNLLLPILKEYFMNNPIFYDSPHNFISENTIYKGSQKCEQNQKIFIPLNARDGCLIVNSNNLQFAPHGAGRKLPVGIANNQISKQQMQQELQQVFVSGERKTSEAPSAYKDIDQFINNLQSMGFKIEEKLKSLFNVKSQSH